MALKKIAVGLILSGQAIVKGLSSKVAIRNAADSANAVLVASQIEVDGDAASALQVVTKQQLEAAVNAITNGLRDPKDAVQAIAEASQLSTHTRTGNVITASQNGAMTSSMLDGVTPFVGMRFLYILGTAGGTSDTNNGIYELDAVGDGSNPWSATRAEDADTSAEVTNGMYVPVTGGNVYTGDTFVLTTADTITLNTTALTFTRVPGAGKLTVSAPLTKTGLNITLDDTAVTPGTYDGSFTVDQKGRLTAAANRNAVDATAGDGDTSYDFTHNLNSYNVAVEVFDNTTKETETYLVSRPDANTVRIQSDSNITADSKTILVRRLD